MSEITTIVDRNELDQAISMCLENGHSTYHFEEGRILFELNNDRFIAGTFYYDQEIHGEPQTSNNPEDEVTHLEEIDGGAEQVYELHAAAISRGDVVYHSPPVFFDVGRFDFGLQVR